MRNLTLSIKKITLLEKDLFNLPIKECDIIYNICNNCKSLVDRNEKSKNWDYCEECNELICYNCIDQDTLYNQINKWICFRCFNDKYNLYECCDCKLQSLNNNIFNICDKCNNDICYDCVKECNNFFNYHSDCSNEILCYECRLKCYGCKNIYCEDCVSIIKINQLYKTSTYKFFCNTCLNNNTPQQINYNTKIKITTEKFEN